MRCFVMVSLENKAKACCPECGASCRLVSAQTIKHHIKQPWLWSESNADDYFCASQGCAIVYFSSQEQIKQDELRLTVGVKSNDAGALICYCFDVSRKDATNPDVKTYVAKQTKAKQCACSVRNPSGCCCLKDFLT